MSRALVPMGPALDNSKAPDGPVNPGPGRASPSCMPRRTRLDGPGVPVHVTDRGDLGRALFVTDEDRDFVVRRAARIFAEEGISCLAFAVMTNHLHLLLVPVEAPRARRGPA